MRTYFLFAASLTITGCVALPDSAVKLPNDRDDASATDGSANGSLDGAPDGSSNGSEAGTNGMDSGGSDGSMSNGTAGDGSTDSGAMCPTPCDTPDKSVCIKDQMQCGPCSDSSQCDEFATTAPVCLSGTGCVECTHDFGGDAFCTGKNQVCKIDANTCVECNVTGDCNAASTKPICDGDTCRGCADDDECLGGTTCDEDSGKCVQCDENDSDACNGKVCNVLTSTCTTASPNSAQVCQPCVSDEQCQVGQLCVNMFADSDGNSSKDTEVGWFCQWRKNGGGSAPAFCDSTVRPYVGEQAGTASLNQPTGSFTICTLAASTCPAITEKFRDSCGRFGSGASSIIVENRNDSDIPGHPVAKELITPDNSVCGIGGKCVAKNADDGAYQCSVPCASSDNDCPAGPFTCGGAPPGLPNVCGI